MFVEQLRINSKELKLNSQSYVRMFCSQDIIEVRISDWDIYCLVLQILEKLRMITF